MNQLLIRIHSNSNGKIIISNALGQEVYSGSINKELFAIDLDHKI